MQRLRGRRARRRPAVVVGLLVLSAASAACGSGQYYRQISGAERDRLTVLVLRVDHDFRPGEHAALVEVTETPTGRTYRRLGATRNWPAERYADAVATNIGNVASSLESVRDELAPGVLARWFADLTAESERISVTWTGGPAPVAEPPGDVLHIHVYHKAAIHGTFVAGPTTYVGVRARLTDRWGRRVYDRQLFSSQWKATPGFLGERHHAAVAKFLKWALSAIWTDIGR